MNHRVVQPPSGIAAAIGLALLAFLAQDASGARAQAGAAPVLSLEVAPVGDSPAMMARAGAPDDEGPAHLEVAVRRSLALAMSPDAASRSWDWEAGVAWAGLLTVRQGGDDAAILAAARAWLDARLAEGVRPRHPNHCTPAWPALLVYERTGEARYLDVAQRCAAYLRDQAARAHGALAHHEDQLWDDTLIVSVPLLARLGALHGCADCLGMAVDEYLAHARRLQDPVSGRWFHGWDASEQRAAGAAHLSAAQWARGNGWAALAATEILAVLPPGDGRQAQVGARLERQLLGLTAVQDASGLWHTVVTRPDFYLESSGSAAIAAAVLRATDAGWVDGRLRPTGILAARAVDALVADDGTLTRVSTGTGVAPTVETYNQVPFDQIKPYGQGLYLLMAAFWR
jgi:unsaturated rhamnogalacturonyl hydrolase